MIERIIEINDIEPVELFGVNDTNFEHLRVLFPQIKMIARGNILKITGERSEINFFSDRFYKLVEHYKCFKNLKIDDITFIVENGNIPTNGSNSYEPDVLVYANHGRIIKALTKNQQLMTVEHQKNDLLFVTGPAGSGKSYTAIALAVKALRNKEVKKIILCRPAVEAGERLGFLPGDLKEKIDPYLQPLYDALNDMLPPRKLESYLEDGTVQIAPVAFMRGRTLDNAFVIIDEAQNTTVNQLKMVLTRMGKHSKFIVNGDITQIDLPKTEKSGLVNAISILKNIEGVGFVQLDESDIVRHPLVKKIVRAYEKEKKEMVMNHK